MGKPPSALDVKAMNDASPPLRQPAIILKLGNANFSLTGAWALFTLAVVSALLIALVAYGFWSGRITPRSLVSPLALSAWLWLLFILYWSAAAKSASADKTSESAGSRGLHQLLLNGAL